MSVLPNLDELPADILHSTRAVAWKFETRDGETTKVPYCARRPFERASVTDAATWSSFADAYDAVADGKVDGAGIVLGDGLVGIDLDHVREAETGAITPEAQALIAALDSYTEISQSGTGLHVLVRGALPAGRRRKPGVEMYDTARYFIVTGQHVAGTPTTINERTPQLGAVHVQIFGPPPPAPSRPVTSTTLDDATLLAKAAAASNGGRFAALWNGDTSSYGGDDSAADLALADLLCFWCARDADRIDRLFRQSGLMREKWDSRRGDSTYGRLTVEKAIADCVDVYEPAIEIVIDDAEPISEPIPAASTTTDHWPALNDEALVGLFGDLIRAVAEQTEADPVALLGHALVFWGNLVGRTPRYRVGADDHCLNENLLCVGDTSIGRKGMALAEMRAVMTQIDPDWAAARVLTGLSTGEGLIFSVRDPLDEQQPIKDRGRVTGYQTVIQDAGVADKRLAVVESEFAKTLRVSRREGNTLSAVVRQAWDHGSLSVLTRNSPLKATGAHVSIIAHCTPRELRSELKSTDMASGLINRFVVLLVRRSRCLPDGGMVDPAVRDELVRRFVAATTAARSVGTITRDADATAHWHSVYPEITRARSGLVGAICNRAPAHVLRLACLYALADRSAVIRLEHQRAAVALWTYAEASATRIFGLRTGHRLADYLLLLLRQSADGLTRTEIRDRLGRNRHADEINEALQLLADYGLARVVMSRPDGGIGRSPSRWYAEKVTT